MDHLEACVELAFTVFPESSAFFQPSEGALDDPSLGHDREGVEFASFGDLHGCPELFAYRFGKRLARISAVGENAFDRKQALAAVFERGQRAVAVCHLGRCDGNRMWQSPCIDCDVALDAGHPLARVIALLTGRIGVLHALRVHDQEAGRATPPLSGAVLAN